MEKLERALSALKIEYDKKMLLKFEKYMDGILLKNRHINLTAITDRDEFIVKHFIDSLLSAGQPEAEKAEKVIDVGTGAGFPGIPLAIVYPEKEFLLMDSLNKRLKIIDELCMELEIKNVITIHSRAEDLAGKKEYRENYDLCVSRAVANMATLSEYCLPFIKKGGYFLAYKGPECESELREGEKAIKILGGKIADIREAELPDFNLAHKIIYIEKIKETAAKYPRKAGIPSKEPLK